MYHLHNYDTIKAEHRERLEEAARYRRTLPARNKAKLMRKARRAEFLARFRRSVRIGPSATTPANPAGRAAKPARPAAT